MVGAWSLSMLGVDARFLRFLVGVDVLGGVAAESLRLVLPRVVRGVFPMEGSSMSSNIWLSRSERIELSSSTAGCRNEVNLPTRIVSPDLDCSRRLGC